MAKVDKVENKEAVIEKKNAVFKLNKKSAWLFPWRQNATNRRNLTKQFATRPK